MKIRAAIIIYSVMALMFQNCALMRKEPPVEVKIEYDEEEKLEEMRKIAHEFFIRGRYQELRGNAEVALDFYSIAFQYDSLNRELCFIVSKKFKESGNYPKALSFAIRGLKLEGTERYTEHKLLGEIYLHLGRIDSSVDYYKKAMELEDGDQEVLYTLATIYEQENKIDEQMKILNKLLPSIQYPEQLTEKQVNLLKMKGKFQELVELYRNAWKATNYNVYGEKLARVYESLEMYTHFWETYKELFDQDPENRYYKAQLARAFLLTDMLDSAYAYYGGLVEEFPDKEEFIFTYGTLLLEKGKPEEAKKYFVSLLEKQPEHSTYHYYLGSIEELLDNKSNAEIEYNKAIKYNENILEYRIKLIVFQMREKRFDEAIKNGAAAVLKNKKSEFAWYISGVTYNRAADDMAMTLKDKKLDDAALSSKIKEYRDSAVARFQHSLSIKKGDVKVMFELGATLEKNKREMEAIGVFEELIKIDSTNANALNYLGYMYVEMNKNMEKAIKFIDRALELEPENGAFLDSKGWWFYKMKEYKLAREYIEKALETGMEDVTVIEHLALIFEKLGDMAAAREQWTNILKLEPDHKIANSRIN